MESGKLVFDVRRGRRPDHPQPQSTHGGEFDSHVMAGEGEANLFRSTIAHVQFLTEP